MKSNSQSHNSSLHAALKDFLVPSIGRLLFVLLLSVLLLAFLNVKALWSFFTEGSLSAQSSDLGDIIDQKAHAVHKFFDSISAGRTLVIIFWLFIGCVVYLLVWFISNLLNNIRNDIVADEYIHPSSYSRKNYWHTIIARRFFFASTLVVLIGYLSVGFKVAILLAKLCYIELENFRPAHSLFIIAASILAVAIMLQILSMIIKITLNTWQYIYRDL